MPRLAPWTCGWPVVAGRERSCQARSTPGASPGLGRTVPARGPRRSRHAADHFDEPLARDPAVGVGVGQPQVVERPRLGQRRGRAEPARRSNTPRRSSTTCHVGEARHDVGCARHGSRRAPTTIRARVAVTRCRRSTARCTATSGRQRSRPASSAAGNDHRRCVGSRDDSGLDRDRSSGRAPDVEQEVVLDMADDLSSRPRSAPCTASAVVRVIALRGGASGRRPARRRRLRLPSHARSTSAARSRAVVADLADSTTRSKRPSGQSSGIRPRSTCTCGLPRRAARRVVATRASGDVPRDDLLAPRGELARSADRSRNPVRRPAGTRRAAGRRATAPACAARRTARPAPTGRSAVAYSASK